MGYRFTKRKKASRHVARQLIALSFLSHLSTDSIPVVDDGGATFTVLDRRWRHPHYRRRWRHPHGVRLTAAPSQCPTDNRLHRLPHITPRPRAGGDRSVCKDEHIDDVGRTVLHFPADGAASVPTCSATWIVPPNRTGPHSSKLADPGVELPTQR